jgi:hypothetical protein
MIALRSVLNKKYFISALYIVSAFMIFFVWVWTADTQNTSFNGDPRSKLSDLINGTAHKPFVTRILLPSITRVVYHALPETWNKSIQECVSNQVKVQQEMQRLGWEKEFVPQYLIALSLSFGFLVIFPFTLRAIVRLLYETEPIVINMLPVLILLGLPIFFHTGTRYIYDFPALSLFTLGFYLVLRKKWYFYYFIFIIGLLNKETMVLLIVPFIFIYYEKLPKVHYRRHLAVHLCLFFAIYNLLMLSYQGNPGKFLEFHLFANIRILASIYTPQQLVIWGIIIILVLYQFNRKPFVLKKTFITVFPFICLTFIFAYINELRDFYEIYPTIALLLLHTIFFSLFQLTYRERKMEELSMQSERKG